MPAPPPLFPSPRGDKLCQMTAEDLISTYEFPSPRGDKLCLKGCGFSDLRHKFPSPRGDKLCLLRGGEAVCH